MKASLILSSILLFTSIGFALQVKPPKDHTLSIGLRLSYIKEHRGAKHYDGIEPLPWIYLGLFKEIVQIVNTSVGAQYFLSERTLRGRTRFSYYTDDPLLKTAGPVDIKNSRQNSVEWSVHLEAYLPDIDNDDASIELGVAKGLLGHTGFYYEVTPKISLGHYFIDEKQYALFEPQLFLTLGYGDKDHNEYQYGMRTTGNQFCQLNAGLWVSSPGRLDPYFPIVKIYYFTLLSESANGTLVTDANKGMQFSLVLPVTIL